MTLASNHWTRENRFRSDILLDHKEGIIDGHKQGDESQIDALLSDAARGDASAVHSLLEQHRDRLRRMVAVRLDRRLASRLDPSDVVQEASLTRRSVYRIISATGPCRFTPGFTGWRPTGRR